MPICAVAREHGIPIVMDADKPTQLDDPLLAMATHVIFSGECLKATTGVSDLTEGLLAAFAKLGKFVAVTDGANDALWCDSGKIVKITRVQDPGHRYAGCGRHVSRGIRACDDGRSCFARCDALCRGSCRAQVSEIRWQRDGTDTCRG